MQWLEEYTSQWAVLCKFSSYRTGEEIPHIYGILKVIMTYANVLSLNPVLSHTNSDRLLMLCSVKANDFNLLYPWHMHRRR